MSKFSDSDGGSIAQSSTPVCLEGRDYQIEADGRWVFSREYLVTREICCGSKCLNCPFENHRRASQGNVDFALPLVSMVPSWTETLIAAGLNVVGRTRYCIHPKASMSAIPVVGGTKTLAKNADEVLDAIKINAGAIRPVVILDREENPKDFVDYFSSRGFDIIVTHVTSLQSLRESLIAIASGIAAATRAATKSCEGASSDLRGTQALQDYAARVERIERRVSEPHVRPKALGREFIKVQGSREELLAALNGGQAPVYYFIWRNPWMAVTRETWIGCVLQAKFRLAPSQLVPLKLTESESKYPTVQESEIPEGAVTLFSSEPYPFEREWSQVRELPFVNSSKSAAIVDGELFSWFGIRAVRFLEESVF